MIRESPIETQDTLWQLVNEAIATGTIPEQWRKAQLSSIPKKDSPINAPYSKQRPISMVETAQKMEKPTNGGWGRMSSGVSPG